MEFLMKYPRFDDVWIAMRVRSYSQNKIIERYGKIKNYLGDFVKQFYIPEIKQNGFTKVVIPYVLFANVRWLHKILDWKKVESDLFNFYFTSVGKLCFFSEQEISDLKRSIEDLYGELLLDDELMVNDEVFVHKGPLQGITGIVKKITGNPDSGNCVCHIEITNGFLARYGQVPRDCVLKKTR